MEELREMIEESWGEDHGDFRVAVWFKGRYSRT